VALDGTELVRRDLEQVQGEDFVDVDFDLLDEAGDVVAYGKEQTVALLVDGKPRVARHLFLIESTRAVAFSPVEGEPIAWIRETSCWPIPEHEGYSAVRRLDDRTLVVDAIGSFRRRTILGAKEWDDALLEAFGDLTRTVDPPSDELLRRARLEGDR
jgi:hypothetical protein